MPTMTVTVKDGAMPLNSCLTASIRCESPGGVVPSIVYVTGEYVNFQANSVWWGSNPWDFTITVPGAKKTVYSFNDASRPKRVVHTLQPVAAAITMPPPPPPPAPGTRLLATYLVAGTPVASMPWVAGSESGVTDSQGNVFVTSMSDLTLQIDGQEIDALGAGEVVTISVTGSYQ